MLHAKPYEMGYLTALEWLPSLLFGLHAGAWLDRRGKRRNAMILADLGRAAAFATIPLCYAFHVLTLAQMCVVTFVGGALSVLFTVSDGTLFVSIVSPDEYVDGQSLIYGSRALSFLGGPSVGGLLVQALSGPYAVVVDALSFLGSAFQLGSIRPVEPPAADEGDGLTVGLRFIADSPIIRASLIGVAVINFFNLMFEALFMLYAVRALGVSAGLLGVVIGAGAIGGILGSVLCKWLTSRLGAGLVYVAGCFVFTVPLALVPLASPAPPHAHAADAVRVLLRQRVRRHGARHQHRRDLRRGDPRHAAVAGVRGVPGDQLRDAARGGAARRAARHRTRPAARAVDRRGRRGARLGPAAAVAAAAVPDAGFSPAAPSDFRGGGGGGRIRSE